MPRQSVFDMDFNRIYSALVAKAEKKGRTKAEVDECIRWLTGYVSVDILDGSCLESAGRDDYRDDLRSEG